MDGVADFFVRYSQRMALLISVVLVVLMGLIIADTVLFFIEDANRDHPSANATEANGGQATARPQIDIAGLNLFGMVQTEAATETVVDAPETKLNLDLRGVFTAEDQKNASAIVAEGAKQGELYRIGDRLPGNALLEAVFNDHILLRRGPRIEKLLFSDAAFRSPASSSGRATNDTSYLRQRPNATQMTSPGAPRVTNRLQQVKDRIAQRRAGNPAQQGQNSIRTFLDTQKDRLQSDPQGLLQDLGVDAVSEGAAQGYKIGSNVNHPALRSTGLRQDDVILSVNGTPVGNLSADSALIDSVLAQKKARVQVQRGKSKFFITVPVP